MSKPVTVHFATNREPTTKNGEIVGFGSALNAITPTWVRYGIAEMTERDGQFGISDLRVAPESIPGVTVEANAQQLLGSKPVFEGLRHRMADGKADLVLMLHGFACDFSNALSNAAEIKSRWSSAKKRLETAIFSWPADGSMVPWMSYRSDRDDARLSAKAISRALQMFLGYLREIPEDDFCGQNIHLVAHSMGNYALRHALQAMISERGGQPLPRVFKTIFLMAADEDDDAFEAPDKFARLPELAESVHVYFARNDLALTISDRTKGNPDRLGSTGPRTLTSLPKKVSLVDCTDVSDTGSATDANHQYYRKRAEIFADVRSVIAGTPSEEIKGRVWVPERSCYKIRGKSA